MEVFLVVRFVIIKEVEMFLVIGVVKIFVMIKLYLIILIIEYILDLIFWFFFFVEYLILGFLNF